MRIKNFWFLEVPMNSTNLRCLNSGCGSITICIVITTFRLIWHQMIFRLVPNQSETNSQFGLIKKKFRRWFLWIRTARKFFEIAEILSVSCFIWSKSRHQSWIFLIPCLVCFYEWIIHFQWSMFIDTLYAIINKYIYIYKIMINTFIFELNCND